MDFEAAVFDLDGTLLDSMDVWEKIDIEFLAKRGLPAPQNYVTEICARSFRESAEYTIELFGLDESVEVIIEEWNRMAAYEYANNVRLMPHTLDYLLRLKAGHIKLAVATGLPEELYKPCLLNNGVHGLFDSLCSTDQVKRGKEYPDIFLFAAAELKVPPQKCIVFEDVLPAIRSAKQAGMITYGVYDKYSAHHQAEIKAIADGYLVDFRDAPLPRKES
ncbi:MAG: HAD family phosphatase [Clostridiales bacterium]|nr:HAD family phosphatase [Clostridiales bacterium]